MANYIIIGGDGKEYGPVTDADVRQWIAEGRLNTLSKAREESDTEWRTLGLFPEFAGAFATAFTADATPATSAEPGALNDGDYDLDVFACIQRGWEAFKENLGTLVGATVVYGAILVALYVVVSFIPKLLPGGTDPAVMLNGPHQAANLLVNIFLVPLVSGPLTAGYCWLILLVIRNRPTAMGDLFAGFQKCYAPACLGSMAMSLVSALCFLPFNLAINGKLVAILSQMQGAAPDKAQALAQQMLTVFVGGLPIFLLCFLPVIYFTVSWMFALPLIIDRQLDWLPALKTSWKMVGRHWWHVFGLVVLTGLINVGGAMLCCVGLLFTIPMTMAMSLVAYEVIFSRPKN